MDKLNRVLPYIDYYLSLKRREILTHATISMKPEDVIPSEIGHHKRILYEESLEVPGVVIQRNRNGWWVPEGGVGLLFNGDGV